MEDKVYKFMTVCLSKLKTAESETEEAEQSQRTVPGLLLWHVVFPDVLLVKVDTDGNRTTRDLSKRTLCP